MIVRTKIRKPSSDKNRQGQETKLHKRTSELEKRCKQAEDRFRFLVDGIPDALIFVNNNGLIILFNEKTTELFGYSSEEILGKSLETLLPERFRRRHRKHESEYFLNPNPRPMGAGHELYGLRKDGSEFPVDISLCPSQCDGEAVVCCSIRDTTERKRMEQELFQSRKLKSLGILAGGIAHKFNNILTVIMGNLSFLKSNIRKSDDSYESIKIIEEACLQAREVAQKLVTFSGGGNPIRKTVSLSDFLPYLIPIYEKNIHSTCHISIPDNLHPVKMDENQIGQVIHNLILNADEAMEGVGIIEVSAENVVVDHSQGLQLPAGGYVRISVCDKGHGIPKDNLDKIFDPFFSTKNIGAGLGLTTSCSIVKNHGGVLVVDSEMEKGSTFSLYLPTAKDEHFVQEDNTDKQSGAKEKRKILLMDDEKLVRDVVERMLKGAGYEAHLAPEGEKAISMYKAAMKSGEKYDAVILDLTVPDGVGGKQTLQELKKIDPDVKAIVSSGYSNEPVMADFKKYGFCGVLPKPFTVEELEQVLGRVLRMGNTISP